MANGKFKMVGRKNIPGHDTDIEVDIGEENEKEHEVVSKPIPEPTLYKGKTIVWFNAFGVRVKSHGGDAKIYYTVTLKKLPAGKTLYALYNNIPNEVPDVQDAGNGNIKFTLNVGDPPVGMG
jgi:hypothetical protein